LISGVIQRELPAVDGVSVLMGANIASEIAAGNFSEATIGAYDEEHKEIFSKLFHTSAFHIATSQDVAAVEMCGTLKVSERTTLKIGHGRFTNQHEQNIVALAAGFVDGLGFGNNAKAAMMRVGFVEMQKLIMRTFPETNEATFMESCGVADLITTCYGGRNRKCAEAFVKGRGAVR